MTNAPAPQNRGTRRSLFHNELGFAITAVPLAVFIAFIVWILLHLLRGGLPSVNWRFLTSFPLKGMTAGGIWPCIVGTLYVSGISLLFSVPVGILSAIYLAEYAPNNFLTRLIRSSIRSLAGIPSVVYGLFGVALFVQGLRIGLSVLASGLTLGLMNLPWIIATSEEAMAAIPNTFREGALALGSTRWEAIRHNVLPYAFPGILTGILLALARTIGETAPILFTGVAYFTGSLPRTPFEKFMALPYHLFTLSTQHDQLLKVRPLAYGTAIVLLLCVLTLDAIAFTIRIRIFSTNKWQV